jgi:hypothetical protein
MEDPTMAELKTNRPYQERFLDGFDRSRLRQEVAATKPRGLKGLKRKYATWALGASLAIGGIGGPLKVIQNAQHGVESDPAGHYISIDNALAGDMKRAESIASQVAGGVASGVEAAVGGAESAVTSPLKAIAEAPKKLTVVTETVREEFFKKEVPFGSIIYHEAKKNGVRPELVAAVVQAESRFKPTARSGAGAIGLMQLVPRTGRWMGARDLTNPVQNIAAGAKYLKYLNDRFDGNETKMIAAYNAGEGNVQRFGGIPPFKETQKYVKKVRTFEQDYHDRVEGRVADLSIAQSTVAEAR